MALEWQTVQVPFSSGLDEDDDPRLVPPGKLVTANNVWFEKNGSLRKRYGSTVDDATVHDPYAEENGASIGQCGMFAEIGSDIVATNDHAIYSKSSTALLPSGTWAYHDRISPVTATRKNIVAQMGVRSDADIAVTQNAIVVAWNRVEPGAVVGNIWYTVLDRNSGATIIPPTKLTTSGLCVYPHLVTVGTSVHLFYADSGGNIYARNISESRINSNSGWTTETTIVITQTYGAIGAYVVCPFDVCAYSTTHLAFVWSDASSARFVAMKLSATTYAAATTLILFNVPVGHSPYACAIDGSSSDFFYVYMHTHNGATNRSVFTSINGGAFTVNTANVNTGWNATATLAPISAVCRLTSSTAVIVTSAVDGSVASNNYTYSEVVNNSAIVSSVGITFTTVSQSRPIVLNSRTYALACPASTYSSMILCDLETDASSQQNMRPVCVIAPNQSFGFNNSINWRPGPALTAYSTTATDASITAYGLASVWRTGDRQAGLDLITYNVGKPPSIQYARVGDLLALGGGTPGFFDGSQFVEAGFLHKVEYLNAVTAAGGSLGNGTYTYALIYQWTDARGNVHRSQPAFATALTNVPPGNNKVTLTFSTLQLTQKQDRQTGFATKLVEVAIYRTTVDGSIYYKLYSGYPSASFQNDFSAATMAYTDSAADSTINTNEILYSDGTVGQTLVSNPVPSAKYVAAYKNRVFLAGCDEPRLILYSNEYTVGIAPVFNLQNALYVPDGDVTGLAVLDEKLIVFTKNSLFALVGQGPTSAGFGTDYTLSKLASDVGCTDARCIVTFPGGIIFRSARGIHLLDRGLNVAFVGADVQGQLETYSYCTSASVIPDLNQIRITCYNGTNAGIVLVYNYLSSTWTTFGMFGTKPIRAAGYPQQQYYMSYADDSTLAYEDRTTCLDGGSWVTATVKTAPLPFAGVQGYQRVRNIGILAQRVTNADFTLTIDAAVTTRSASTTETHTFAASTNDEWTYKPANQKVESISVTLSDATPSGGLAVTTGRGFAFQGLAFEVGSLPGIRRRSETQKT